MVDPKLVLKTYNFNLYLQPDSNLIESGTGPKNFSGTPHFCYKYY